MTTHAVSSASRGLPPRRRVIIQNMENLTPQTWRLTLHGPALHGFETGSPGAHIKLILPGPGAASVPEPLRYEGRRAVFEEGAVIPFLRTYTPLRYNPDRLELEVEMLLHGDSPASRWLSRAELGQEIVVAGTPGRLGSSTRWRLVCGGRRRHGYSGGRSGFGSAARPADHRVLGRPQRGGEAQHPRIPRGLPHWLFAGPGAGQPGESLEEAVRSFSFPPGKGYVWVALESGAMRRVRGHLLNNGGIASRTDDNARLLEVGCGGSSRRRLRPRLICPTESPLPLRGREFSVEQFRRPKSEQHNANYQVLPSIHLCVPWFPGILRAERDTAASVDQFPQGARTNFFRRAPPRRPYPAIQRLVGPAGRRSSK